MQFCSMMSRDWKTTVKTGIGIFSFFAIVLMLPMLAEARDYHIRASDGEVYTVTLGEEPGVKNFSVQDSNGEMLRGVTEIERATAAELYFAARLFAEVLPLYSPDTPFEDIEEWITDIAKGAIIKLLTKQGLDILTNGLVNGFTGAVQLILGGDVVSIAEGWIPGAAADAIGDELENRLLVDAAVIAKGAARKTMEQEQILRAFWLAYETRSIVISMGGVNAAWAGFHKWIAYHSLTTNLVNRYLRDPESEVSLGTGSLGSIATSLLPAAGGIVTTLSTIDTIIGGIEAVESHAYTLEHLQRLQDINETAVSDIQQYSSSRIVERKNQSRADLDQASFFQPITINQLEDIRLFTDDLPQQLDVRDYSSPSGTDNLTYRGRSSDVSVAVAQVERSGSSVIIITPKEVGTTSVTVELITLRGLSVSQSFIVRVADRAQQNQPPEAVGTISEQNLTVPGPARPVDMASYFSSENDLIYDAESDSSDIVTESVSGSQVTLTPIQEGRVTVTVTARVRENPALSATQTILVTVRPNSATIVRPPAPDEDTYVPVEDATIVRPTSVPDLIVESIEADKTTLDLGERFQIDTRVWNKGKAISGATTLRYFLSTDETISSEEDTEVASERVEVLSGRGAHPSRRRAELTQTFTAPDTSGTYYYGVCIDDVVDESDTENNCSEAIKITVRPQTPDIVEPQDSQGPQGLASSEPDVVDTPDLSPRVFIPDAKLRAAVRAVLSLRPDEVITQRQMQRLTRLHYGEEAVIEDPTLPIGFDITAEGKANQSGIKNLAGLEYATNLKELSLLWHPISNITPLANLMNLTELVLGGNQVVDIRPLAGLTNLTELVLWGNKISDLSPLVGLTNLTVLTLSYNRRISDLSPLAGLTNLTELGLAGNQISDLRPLAGLTNLTELVLGRNQVVDISPLVGLTNLTVLSLWANKISDLSPLVGLTNLTKLALGANRRISDLSPLVGLTNLRELSLWANKISDLSPLAGLTNLRELSLGANQISDLRPLAGLTNLTELTLWWNQIRDIKPLAGLTNLTSLSLRGNQISDLRPLAGLTNLTELDLSNNPISDLRPLVGLTNLTLLVLWQNPIVDLAPLRRLKEKNPGMTIWGVDLNNAQGAPSSPVLPDETALLSNYPNPFNPETWIPYQLAKAADVTLTIYDVRGVMVRQLTLGHQPAGFYQSRARAAHWDGRNQLGEKVASGLYFYTFTAGDFTATQKLLIRK